MSSIKDLQGDPPAIANKIQSSTDSEFNDLADFYYTRLVRLANLFLDSIPDAEEVVQDAALRAYRGLPKFRYEAHISTWLYRIVINQANNRRKQLKKYNIQQSLEQLSAISSECEPALQVPESQLPYYRIYRREFMQTMHNIINQLPYSMQTVARLRFIEQYSYAAIARKLHCAPGTVKSRLSRARQLIKYLMIKHQDDLF